MSIASEIQRLSGVRTDIFDSLTAKGVTVPVTATFSSCPDLIDSIQTGGGNTLYNTGFEVSASIEQTIPFTADQKIESTSAYEDFTEEVATGFISKGSNYANIEIPLEYITGSDVDNYICISGFVNGDNEPTNQVYLAPDDVSYISQTAIGSFVTQGILLLPYENLLEKWAGISSWASKCVIQIRSEWWQASDWSIDSCIISGSRVTGVTTAYLYPDRPTNITGNIVNDITGVEGLNKGPDGIYASYYNTGAIGPYSYNSSFSSNFGGNVVSLAKDNMDNAVIEYKNYTATAIDSVAPNSAYDFTLGIETITSGITGDIC